jgi:hypothetical protein
MSKYFVNKFLFQVSRNPALLAGYIVNPSLLVARWERDHGRRLGSGNSVEKSDWLSFTSLEREALSTHDYVSLFECGAHFVLTSAVFMAVLEQDSDLDGESSSAQHEFARNLAHWSASDYPSIAL